MPLVPYNIASRTGVNITPQTIARLAELSEIIAVKEASGNLAQMSEILNLCGDKLDLLSGDDVLTLPVLAIGGKGVISVVNNIVPQGGGRNGGRLGKGRHSRRPKEVQPASALEPGHVHRDQPHLHQDRCGHGGAGYPAASCACPCARWPRPTSIKLEEALKAHGLLAYIFVNQ